jgi:energy-coupling factor transport system ATP-binding protein
MIQISDFTFKYSDKNIPAVKGINLLIREGEFILLTGPSGCGKSTLIRSLNGLIPHFYGGVFSGKVESQGFDTREKSTRFLSQKIGMVFQNPDNQLFMNTVESEVAFGLENLGLSKKLIRKRIEETLSAVGISHLKKKGIHALSGGEKQKVAICAILAMQPEVLLLDEPTSELDPQSSEEILMLIQKLNEELGITIVLIEHRIERVINYVDRVIVMNEGAIIHDGAPKHVFSHDLISLGVSTPPIIELFNEMKHRKFDIKEIPFNVKDCRNALHDILKKVHLTPKQNQQYQRTIHGRKNLQNSISPLLEIKNLNFHYDKEKPILKKISLSAFAGEFISIIGRNGSGKTTLIKQLNGLLRSNRGTVKILGEDITNQSIAQISKNVGFIFQNPALQFYHDTLLEEIEFVYDNFHMSASEKHEQIDTVLTQFQLQEYIDTYPKYLSRGEQQRAALASILIRKPKILVLDEPTHGMDNLQKINFFSLLQTYCKEGNLVIMVSHDIESIAQFSDRIIFLSEGEIVVDDLTHEVLTQALLFSPQINRLIHPLENIPKTFLTTQELLEIIDDA